MANIKDKALYFVGNKLLKYVYKNPQKICSNLSS